MFNDLELTILTGNTHPELAVKVCEYLNTPLGAADVFEFTNQNIFVRILENVRHHDVFIIQPTSRPVNTGIMELLIMIDAVKRASAGRITAVLPYYAYGRSDKKDQPRVPVTGRLIADLLTVAGANRVLTIDLHAPQIQGFFNIPVDELTALYTLSRYFQQKNLDNLVVVAPDVGKAKDARNFAARLNAPVAIVEKRRVGNEDKAEALNIIGDVEGRRALMVDDEIDTGGTIIEAANLLLAKGVTEVYACCTHPIFSGQAIERLNSSQIKEVVVTNTVPLPHDRLSPKVTVLSIASLLGEAIYRIHTGLSVGAMFEE
ncbi:MAG: ribose-phosphate pyrophosphokinase [Dehalococcoidia bacterium]|nr:ribose-phosphate pyrophosphokinase [Dehalococcoidia bacterium]